MNTNIANRIHAYRILALPTTDAATRLRMSTNKIRRISSKFPAAVAATPPTVLAFLILAVLMQNDKMPKPLSRQVQLASH